MMIRRFGFPAAVFAIAACVTVGQVSAATVSVQLVNNSDDAEENLVAVPSWTVGNVDLNSSDLEIGTDYQSTATEDDNRIALVGLRFPSVAVPFGATINSASIVFTVDENDPSPDPASYDILGELSLNPATYAATDFSVSSRPDTTASVLWDNVPSWTGQIGNSGADQTTADLSAIVQEIIDQTTGAGWISGNAMAFTIQSTPGTVGATRTAENPDVAGGQGAILNIDFTPIPEPSSVLLVSLAAMIGFVGRRRSFC